MNKSSLRGALGCVLCACALTLFQLQANAASYQPSISNENGNTIIDLIGPTPGLIEMNITFNTLNNIGTTLYFDQLTTSDLTESFTFNISNNTGIPWAGLAIGVRGGSELIVDDALDSWMNQPQVTPTTGTLFGVLPVASSTVTGLPYEWAVAFGNPADGSGLDPETVGMVISGTVNQLLVPSPFLMNFMLIPPPDTVVPIPPAVWLFGSGLLGLIGMARRRKA